jgi:hypothetical protein
LDLMWGWGNQGFLHVPFLWLTNVNWCLI